MSESPSLRIEPDRVVCPPLAEVRAPQRARVAYRWAESGGITEGAEDGWVLLDGTWVHFLSDADTHWATWPPGNIVAIEWAMELPASDQERDS